MALRNDFDQLVDVKNGFISREIFVDANIFREELDKVFTRAWLLVGHESLVPDPGDFYTSRMGEESVILCRDKKVEIHVFLNSCRHRGMKVCRYEQGNTSLFTCPYHSWTYTTDGNCKAFHCTGRYMTGCSTVRPTHWSRWRNSAATRVRSGRPGTRTRRTSSPISATPKFISTRHWIVAMAARAAPR